MPFGLVSAWNKRRRSLSYDQIDPWIYRPAQCWQLGEEVLRPKRRSGGGGGGGGASVFTLREMEAATCSFADGNSLGRGGFGRVYRGTLSSGQVVAIKRMEAAPPLREAEKEREFRVEVDVLSRVDHPNVVSLVGYCAEGDQRLLVYEYLSRGHLQGQLHGTGGGRMEWPVRLRVALGVGRGLAYLHSGSAVGIPIAHMDLKSTNILLGEDFEAKISDFGLAKFMPEGPDGGLAMGMQGTFGYFDPEYASTGNFTLKSDVYAFGVVLLELLTGRRAIDLHQGPPGQSLILQLQHLLADRKGLRRVIDRAMPRSSCTMESVVLFAGLAARCVCLESGGRPAMADCVAELQLALSANMRRRHRVQHPSLRS
ncbi:unnamed protein product [Spirodela intermedia]|uniref:non-specific serine/threonine protein kinase n=2 Tax=Spirodela intermedia TaxID=51605 RepID=A0A7I8JJV4_SPIIN|nr:unnamed protein product [Spirodela intermedia]CAA6670065.1 unnamed protein product [Spirodela intermedia]CAA7407106.1 unnamed protein product [Spirodela intermedia]